jgi:hypothetical protein
MLWEFQERTPSIRSSREGISEEQMFLPRAKRRTNFTEEFIHKGKTNVI